LTGAPTGLTVSMEDGESPGIKERVSAGGSSQSFRLPSEWHLTADTGPAE